MNCFLRCRKTSLHSQAAPFRGTTVGQTLFAVALTFFLSIVGNVQISAAETAPKFSTEQNRFFEAEVLPILKTRCWECHGGDKVKGELHLTSREEILKGGESGLVISLDKPLESRLLKAIGYTDDNLKMPKGGKLPKNEIAILTKWIKEGVYWSPNVKIARKETVAEHGSKITAEARQYWAYQPVKKSAVPTVRNGAWIKNPIDAFLLAKLEAKELAPTKPAEPIALIRRLYYDLTGLPPKPEEIDAFLKESTANRLAAYEALIDRLLASPHYGEKWGRHWLDLVRYAETNGYERDGPKPFVWRYRDYVIKSFNDDKPYDQFIREQLAGDEMPGPNPEAIIATGYYRLGHLGRRAGRPRASPLRRFRRYRGDNFASLSRHDDELRPLPRPQNRSDSAEGLLQHVVVLQRYSPLRSQPGYALVCFVHRYFLSRSTGDVRKRPREARNEAGQDHLSDEEDRERSNSQNAGRRSAGNRRAGTG